jgi:hypothetical protein
MLFTKINYAQLGLSLRNRERNMSDKILVSFEIYDEANDMLKVIAKQYDLPDTSKAIRCLLDYAAKDGDWDEIFKVIRCRHC